MTPAARAQAAITILDQIIAGEAAEAALLRWSRASRFAGSGDRAAVRDLVFDSLRRMRSRAALGGGLTGRGLLIGMCREEGIDVATIFSGFGHAPAALTPDEVDAGRKPTANEAVDLPDWLEPLWSASLGDRAAAIADIMRDRAPVWIRVNTARATPEQALAALAEDGVSAEASELLGNAMHVTEGARRLSNSRAYREGLVELQDLSPQLTCASLPVADRVLDYCAGGGGKSLALAARGNVDVTAHDANPARMSDIPARAARAGIRIKVTPPGKIKGTFGLVVVDVPCSGSGTWRRTPDAKWRLSRADLDRLIATQAAILDEASRFVAPDGYLAYMTCSVLTEENDAQIGNFVARSDFRVVEQRLLTPLQESDGFFMAVMKRI